MYHSYSALLLFKIFRFQEEKKKKHSFQNKKKNKKIDASYSIYLLFMGIHIQGGIRIVGGG